MLKNLSILLLLAIIIALPFVLRQEPPATGWHPGDPELVIVTPHNEAIRYEFARGFSRWHQEKFGRPVKVEWRAVGGTTEIMRFLVSEYAADVRRWWVDSLKKDWPVAGAEKLTQTAEPAQADQAELWRRFRATDDPDQFSCRIDLFFGGGEYDHSSAYRQGLMVAPWAPGEEPPGLFAMADGTELIPRTLGGETWRTPTVLGNVISAFGICYNSDRLADLGVKTPPSRWSDMADPAYFKQVGAGDPTKSGSLARAFELMIHQKIHEVVRAAGFSTADAAKFEKAIADLSKQKGKAWKRYELPEGVPAEYQQAIERGWLEGVAMVQLIGANARYFTDTSSRVPIDVSVGDAAVGMSIDFLGRSQEQLSAIPGRSPPISFVAPLGGTSASCDPIGLLRGAGGHAGDSARRRETRRIAVRFIQFTLSEEGQRLWTYRPGEPGGPEKFALRRLPIRRDFYPSTNPVIQARHLEHLRHAADNLADPSVDPYRLAQTFTYWPRWSGSHFAIQRDMVRVMCMDAGDELHDAWRAIIARGGPAGHPEAMKKLREPPTVRLRSRSTGQERVVELNWRTAPDILKEFKRDDVLREWTIFYRKNYAEVKRMVENK